MFHLSLEGKTCLVTGGTAGIGLEISKAFAANDATVIITGRDDIRGQNALEEVQKSSDKSNHMFYKCDSGKADEIESTCKKIISSFDSIDIIVLNAATEFAESINEIKIDNWDRVFDVNVKGVFCFIKHLSFRMIEKKKGNIIIIGSVVSSTGAGGGMHYTASKSALKGISARINYELHSSVCYNL